MTPRSREVIVIDDLAPHLLLQNGNYLYKIPFRNGWAVLKVYYGSRGTLSRITKSIENVVFAGQTSYMPRTRLRVERECLALWQSHGFRVFRTFEDVEVVARGCPPGGYLLMEYLVAPKLVEHLADEEVDDDVKYCRYHRFLAEWSRRHDLAIEHREPRLVHENGDGKHVLLLEDGGFLWFDFEMVYRSRSRVEDHVSHEIIQYLWHILKSLPEERRDRFLDETIAGYPARERLARAYDYFFRHPNPLYRLGRALDRRFSQRSRKSTSKYNVARRLVERLGAS